MTERVPYDEMSMFRDNCEEYGIPWRGQPTVVRRSAALPDGRQLSALVWGSEPASVVFLHGGAQNAHTWDTVALALDRPLVAIDLPGHGHSDGGANGSLALQTNAADVAAAIEALAVPPVHLVGMSLGGMTSLAVAALRPDLIRTLTLVDVTPGVDQEKSKAIAAFVNGPKSFDSFDDLLARTIEFNPTRTESSLRRGILHNALQREDGSWVWRYRRFDEVPAAATDGDTPSAPTSPRFGDLWDVVGALEAPLFLARGMRSQSVVDDADEAELLRRQPGALVVHFEQSGHSIQGDEPVELAAQLARFFDAH